MSPAKTKPIIMTTVTKSVDPMIRIFIKIDRRQYRWSEENGSPSPFSWCFEQLRSLSGTEHQSHPYLVMPKLYFAMLIKWGKISFETKLLEKCNGFSYTCLCSCTLNMSKLHNITILFPQRETCPSGYGAGLQTDCLGIKPGDCREIAHSMLWSSVVAASGSHVF